MMHMAMGLTLSYYRGKLMAGYFTLPVERHGPVARSKELPEGLVVDYDEDGHEVGIEIVDPSPEAAEALLRLAKQLQLPNAEEELAPLRRQVALV
jgi:uncharacterized protein YuzE